MLSVDEALARGLCRVCGLTVEGRPVHWDGGAEFTHPECLPALRAVEGRAAAPASCRVLLRLLLFCSDGTAEGEREVALPHRPQEGDGLDGLGGATLLLGRVSYDLAAGRWAAEAREWATRTGGTVAGRTAEWGAGWRWVTAGRE